MAPDRSGVNGADPAVFVQGWRQEINTSPAPWHRDSYGYDYDYDYDYDQGMNLAPLSWITDLFHTAGTAVAKHS